MKKIFLGVAFVAALSLSGCIAKMTGPGSNGADLTKMKQVNMACFIHVLGFGPFDNAVLKEKVDAIEYSIENYVVWSRVCAVGYKK